MIRPRWVITRTQPIAIDDVLDYLVAALQSQPSTGQVIEVGGATIETYRSMMLTYARARRLRRPLIEGLRTEVVCKNTLAAELFPAIQPMGYAAAIEKTLNRALPDESLSAALPSNPGHVFVRRDGILCDVHQALADASPKDLFSVITRLGGSNGYLYANSLWRFRGWLDQCLGGVGTRRNLGYGPLNKNDHIDFWYVQALEAGRRLVLRAEMKLPGRAWLEFLLSPQPSGRTLVRCSAWFEPRGLLGELYWWALYPIHVLIFKGMVQALCRKAAGRVTMQAHTTEVR